MFFRSVNVFQRYGWCAFWHIDEAKLQPNYADAQRYLPCGGGAIHVLLNILMCGRSHVSPAHPDFYYTLHQENASLRGTEKRITVLCHHFPQIIM